MGEETESKQRLKPTRLILHNFLSSDECNELEFIHKSSSTVGYRENVFSTTLSHLIATNCPHFLLPFISIRERLKEKVEEFFGCEFQLLVEFTSLISWTKGAKIGWHSDDNRPYLKQRDFTAVCYLNSYGEDFKGGLFHFQDGEPTTFVPMAGDVAIYTADSRNVHSVDEIIEGERLTLTLWFSCDSDHDEDAKLISHLSKWMLNSSQLKFPILASINMYWYSSDPGLQQHLGFDICCARIYSSGFDIYCSNEENYFPDLEEMLMKPLKLSRGNELFEHEFVNILHALQVVQFYYWKVAGIPCYTFQGEAGKVVKLSESQAKRISSLKSLFVKDPQQAEMVFGALPFEVCEGTFDRVKFSAAIYELENYACKLYRDLAMSLPGWKRLGMLYHIPDEGF